MSTLTREFTKEQLIQKLKHRISVASGFPDSEKAKMDLELARIALASLEAEAVAEVYEGFTLRYIGHGPAPKSGVRVGDRLYTAPPAPLSVPTFDEWCQRTGQKPLGWVRDVMKEAYEGCASAMLQGAENVESPTTIQTAPDMDSSPKITESPSSNSPAIPDGWVACSERMPEKGQEVLCTDEFENYETALYDTGYIPGPPFFATTAGEFHPTHWMPMPAAPQQEMT